MQNGARDKLRCACLPLWPLPCELSEFGGELKVGPRRTIDHWRTTNKLRPIDSLGEKLFALHLWPNEWAPTSAHLSPFCSLLLPFGPFWHTVIGQRLCAKPAFCSPKSWPSADQPQARNELGAKLWPRASAQSANDRPWRAGGPMQMID